VTALSYAQTLGCPRVHVMAGVLPEAPMPNARAASLDVRAQSALRGAGGRGRNGYCDSPSSRSIPATCRYFLTTQAESPRDPRGGRRDERVGADGHVHAQIVEGDLSEKLRRWLPHIGTSRSQAMPGRHEPDVGEISYRHLFALLDELATAAGWAASIGRGPGTGRGLGG